jgi:formylglycine-generating enzyme required for sulfatase activity
MHRVIATSLLSRLAAWLLVSFATVEAFARQDDGFEWATITNPGNRGTNAQEAPFLNWYTDSIGSVAYEYRMAKTEVTAGQWVEFVRAYAPYHTGAPWDPGLIGEYVFYDDDTGEYIVPEVFEHFPNNMSWRNAARYCNWLHNGKSPERSAFETGAYDTSTFIDDPITGESSVDTQHLPGAKFWIPTLDEWAKAAHYDPNRYGPGQEGFWTYFGPENKPLVPGEPGTPGAQTSAGTGDYDNLAYPIKSYPDTVNAWGLWDISGGVSEYTSTYFYKDDRNVVVELGSKTAFVEGHTYYDRVDAIDATGVNGAPATGLRMASLVPSSPSSCIMFAVVLSAHLRKRRLS